MDQVSEGPPCARHPDQRATATCSRCGDFTCAACQVPGEAGLRCPSCAERQEKRPLAGIPPGSRLAPDWVAGRSLWLTWKLLVRGTVLHLIPAPFIIVGCVMAVTNTVVARTSGPQLLGLGIAIGLFLAVAALHVPAQVVLARLFHDRLGGGSKGVFAASAGSAGRSLHLLWVEVLRALIVGLPLVPLVAVKTTGVDQVALWFGCLSVAALLTVPLSLAVPVVVFEGLGGLAALRRSASLVSRAAILTAIFLGGASVVAFIGWALVAGCGGAFLPLSSTGHGFFAMAFLPTTGLFMAAVTTCVYFGLRSLEG